MKFSLSHEAVIISNALVLSKWNRFSLRFASESIGSLCHRRFLLEAFKLREKIIRKLRRKRSENLYLIDNFRFETLLC